MADLIQFRRDTLERWEQYNPVLAEGEPGFVLGTANQYKIGDGVHAWNDLPMKGFNGNIVDEFGDGFDSVISQGGLTNLFKYIINNGSAIHLKNGVDFSVLDDVKEMGLYVLYSYKYPAYHMLVNYDNGLHQVNQWIFGNLIIEDDGKIRGTHQDGIVTIVHRSCPIFGTNKSWTTWKYIQEYFIKGEDKTTESSTYGAKYISKLLNNISEDMSNLEVKLSRALVEHIKSSTNMFSVLDKKFNDLNTRTDDVENSANNAAERAETALTIANDANNLVQENCSMPFYGFTTGSVVAGSMNNNNGFVRFHTERKVFVIVSNEETNEIYTDWPDACLYHTETYSRKNKIYIYGNDLYVFNNDDFQKVGKSYQEAIDILNSKAGSIIHCVGIRNESGILLDGDDVVGNYLVKNTKNKFIGLKAKTESGNIIDVSVESGTIINYGSLYYGYNGKMFSPIGGGSGSGSGSGYYNVTKEIPLENGYYTLALALSNMESSGNIDDDDKMGMIITFESAAGDWEDYRFIGTSIANFFDKASWEPHGGKGAVKKINVVIGTNEPQEVIPDKEGNVTLNIPAVEIDETIDEGSTNPVQNKTIAAELKRISGKYGASLRLNTVNEGDDKAYSVSLLTEDGEELSTTDLFTGGGGGGSIQATKIVLSRLTPNMTIKSGDEVKLSYKYDQINTETQESTGEPANVTITISRGATSNTFSQVVAAGAIETLDVTKYLGVGTNSIKVKAEVGEEGAKQVSSISWSINVVQLVLTSSFNIATIIQKGDVVSIPFALSGSGNKLLRCYVDGVDYEDRSINASSTNGSFSIQTSDMNHGVHTIQLVAELTLVDETVIKSNSVYFGIAVRVKGNSKPIIATKFEFQDGTIIKDNTLPYIPVRQFENYTITFAAYNPYETPTKVEVYELGSLINSSNVAFVTTKLNFRAMSYGTEACKIVCGSTEFHFNLISQKSDLNLTEPTDNLMLKLTAQGRSNNDTNKEEWTYKGITTDMKGFNWGGDGWTGLALRHKGAARSIVNYQPLKQPGVNANNALAFLIKFKVSEVSDETTPVISCIDSNGTGFEITPSEARIVTRGNSKISMKMASDSVYEVGFVSFPEYTEGASEYERQNSKMLYMYIDGKMSGGVQRGESDSVYQTNPQNISMGSSGATLDVYNMRAWSTFLTDSQVLDCNILDKENVDDLLNEYNENDILNDNGEISVDNVKDGMRIVIITGKQASGQSTVEYAAVQNNKKTKYNVDEILTYIKGQKNSPLNFRLTGGSISLQGTSSLAYPIKNYRIYLRDANKKDGQLYLGCNEQGVGGELQAKAKYSFRLPDENGVRPAPVNCFCLKADFAESSSSHNTGMARMVQETLVNCNELTPAQKAVDRNKYKYDVRTTIDGEPCLLFYRGTIHDTPKFLGKFNWNNDKSTEAVFGFLDIPGYHDQAWVTDKFQGNNPTECWEFLNNDYPMGMFKDDDFDSKDDEGVPNWLKVFEARFPDNNDDYEDGTKEPIYLKRLVKWVKSTDTTAVGLSSADKIVRQNKFKTELKDYFDVNYLCDYYTLTDLFACVDQRVKNMMMGFWYNPDVDKVLAYMIFYDNDTILGVRNDGRLRYDWDIDEETIDPELSSDTKKVYAFAGHDSVLWKNLRDCFQDELNAAYVRIRQNLSNAKILDYFDVQQSDKFCSRIFNIDAINKYIIPKTIGIEVIDEDSGQVINKMYSYLEAMQGSRKAHRHYFISNRVSLFDAKASTGNYTATDINWKGNSAAGAKVSAVAAREFYFEFKREGTSMIRTKVTKGQEWSYTYNEMANIGTIFHLYGGAWMNKLDLAFWGGFTDLQIPKLPVLEELILGKDNTTYSLTELVIGTNLPMLKKIIMPNYINLPSLNLESCSQLEYIDASGCSNLSTISLAESAPLTYFHIPDGYQTLVLRSLPLIERSGLIFDNIRTVTSIWVENCNKLNGYDLFREMFTMSDKAIKNVRLTGLSLEGDGSDLRAYYEAGLGGLDTNGNIINNHCKICGDYQLTSYINDETFELWNNYFDELNIRQPQYSLIHSDDSVSDDRNFTNEDNKTGYAYDNEYVVSGHMEKILSKRYGCLGKQVEDGEMTICKLNPNNFNFYADGDSLSNSTPAILNGNEGDAFIYEPHYWYKGINDILGIFSKGNSRKYYAFSSNEKMPDVPNCKKFTYDELKELGFVSKGFKVNLGMPDIESAITADSSYTYIKVDIEGYKNVRYPTVVGPLLGSIITDSKNKILSETSVSSLDIKLVNGMYVINKIPSDAKWLHFTVINSVEWDDVILSNSDKVEDMEPEWVEHIPCLTAMFEAINIKNGLYSAADGVSKAIVNQTQPTFDIYAKQRKLQLVDWEMHKDVANLFFAKYGRRNAQDQCGYGQNTTTRIIGSSAFLGMTDTINHEGKVEYAWNPINDEQMSCSRCLGYENWWGNVAEWMGEVELKSSEPYKFQIKTYDGSIRKVLGTSASGNYIKYIYHQKYMDVLSVGNSNSGTQNTFYGDIFYTAGGNQVVDRSYYSASPNGGVSCAGADNGSSHAYTYMGVRLAFRGTIKHAISVSVYKSLIAKY